MGAILGITVVVLLFLIFAILWFTGVMRPKQTPGRGAANASKDVSSSRSTGLD